MDAQIFIFLGILFLGLYLFVKDQFPVEVSALILMLLLVVSGIISKEDAIEGFGNESIIFIGSLFVIVIALQKSGALNYLEKVILQLANNSPRMAFGLVLLFVGAVSAFISNTVTVALAIPIVVSISKKINQSPKAWLMPLAFASVLGGMGSLIGTSTNIIVSSQLPNFDLPNFGLFTPAPVGLPIIVIGLIFLFIFSRVFLKGAELETVESVDIKYDIRSYTAEIVVEANSQVAHRKLKDCSLFRDLEVIVLAVNRGGQTLFPRATLVILPNDTLVIEGNIKKVAQNAEKSGLKFAEQVKLETGKKEKSEESNELLTFHEILVTGRSFLQNRTPSEVYLRNRYRISLIAINRHGVTIREKLSDVRIQAGDILVVHFSGIVDNSTLDYLGLVPLQEFGSLGELSASAYVSVLIFAAVLLAGTYFNYPMSLSCLAGAILLVVTGNLEIQEVYEKVEWRILIFIGAILALGKGMVSSGTAHALASLIADNFSSFPPIYSLGLIYVATVVLTNPLSNQAAAVIMLPIAVSTAQSIGCNAMPFVMAVTFAASCCFVTPFEPVFMLVYGPGDYKFSDFYKLGAALTVICFVLSIVLIPIFWPFY